MKKKQPEVLEINDRGGLFTQGKVRDVYEAHEMFLDWYYDSNKDVASRRFFEEYWSFPVEQLSPENIKKVNMMRCNNCDQWTIDDNECFECFDDGKLDRRTTQDTFVNFF